MPTLQDFIGLLHTPAGFGFATMREGAAMDPETFHKLPQAEHGRLQAGLADLLGDTGALLLLPPSLRRRRVA